MGLGALQIGSGIEVLGWVGKAGTLLLVTVVAVLTLAFVASAVSGVSRGIQWLSNINMVLALVLAIFVFVVGPTVLILNLLPTALGDYAANLAAMSARSAEAGGDTEKWLSSWTIFYWAWWISWTPFVGMFLARISRGRTYPAVRHRRDPHSDDREPAVVRRLRRCGHRPAARRHRHLRQR